MSDLATIPADDDTRIVRWTADVFYRTANGIVDVRHDLEELVELHNLVECGPHWDTIDRIYIERSDKAYAELTVEQAEQLRG